MTSELNELHNIAAWWDRAMVANDPLEIRSATAHPFIVGFRRVAP